MLQAAVCDGCTLDALALGKDCPGLPKIDVGGREVVDALVIAGVVVVLDEGVDLPFEISRRVVVVEQNAVLQGLVPALELSLGLGMIRCPAHVLHAFVLEPIGQIDPPPFRWTPMLGFRARRGVSDEREAAFISGGVQARGG